MPLPNQDATQIVTNNGLRTQYGVLIPPGAKVAAFVRSTGAGDDGADQFLIQNLVLTLAAGLARCRPGKGDFVIVLPGHAENVTDASTFSNALVAGAQIIGLGKGAAMPTFTWTATAGRWIVNQSGVVISGLRLLFDGINSVTTAMLFNAADCAVLYNDIEVSTTGSACAVGLSVAAGATRLDISGNVFRGLSSVPVTTAVLSYSGITDGVRLCDNEMLVPGPTAGFIVVSAAILNHKFLRNTWSNTTAASVAAIAYSNVAVTGQCSFNNITVLNGGAQTPGTTGITVGGTNNLTGYFQNFVTNSPNTSGVISPAVDA